MAESKRSTAQVIRLLTDHGEPLMVEAGGPAHAGEYVSRFVINSGARHGVKNSDKYLIFSLGEDITDPATGESLGRLEIVRGRASVVHVQENLSILRSEEKKFIRRPNAFSPLERPEVETIDEPLRVLRVGDFARPI